MTQSDDRAVMLGRYIIKNKATVREAAAWSGISKSTVHSDVTKRLSRIDSGLFKQVRKVLDENKAERHMRGGMATKEKWEKKAEERNGKTA